MRRSRLPLRAGALGNRPAGRGCTLAGRAVVALVTCAASATAPPALPLPLLAPISISISIPITLAAAIAIAVAVALTVAFVIALAVTMAIVVASTGSVVCVVAHGAAMRLFFRLRLTVAVRNVAIGSVRCGARAWRRRRWPGIRCRRLSTVRRWCSGTPLGRSAEMHHARWPAAHNGRAWRGGREGRTHWQRWPWAEPRLRRPGTRSGESACAADGAGGARMRTIIGLAIDT